MTDLHRCLQENVLCERNKWKRWDSSMLDIFDSLVKKETHRSMWLTATPIGIYWHQILFSTEKVINFIRNWTWLTSFSWGFNQEMKAECENINFYTRVFWSSIGQIWKNLINLWEDISLFVLRVLFFLFFTFCFFEVFGGVCFLWGFLFFVFCFFWEREQKCQTTLIVFQNRVHSWFALFGSHVSPH